MYSHKSCAEYDSSSFLTIYVNNHLATQWSKHSYTMYMWLTGYYDSIPKMPKKVDVILREKIPLWSFLLWNTVNSVLSPCRYYVFMIFPLLLSNTSLFHTLLTPPPESKCNIKKGAIQISQFYSLSASLLRESESERKNKKVSWDQKLKLIFKRKLWNYKLSLRIHVPPLENKHVDCETNPCSIWQMP